MFRKDVTDDDRPPRLSSRPPTSSRPCSSSSPGRAVQHETAKAGNTSGMVGMAIALAATIWLALSESDYAVGTRRR